ncbi:MAG TPA: protein kinase [Thermoanaerobaculia bacterium]|nr:protein kinase [Thermoanaerobaculia bacterium]
MKTKPLVMLCWIQVIVAAVMVIFNFTSRITRPTVGFDYSRVTRKVTVVIPDTPAEAAGIREGDVVVSFNGHAVGPGVVPLFFTRAGEPVPIVLERGGVARTLLVTPILSEEMRQRDLRGGTRRAVSAISGYLNFPLHIWMLALSVALLKLRPDSKDARISALSLAYWAGGMFAYNMSGFGAILEALPQSLRLPFFLVDAIYSAGFFPLCLHFAIIFPSERVRVRRVCEFVPYLAAVPVVIESIAHGLRRLDGDVRPAPLPWGDAFGTIGASLLFASLIVLAVRFARMRNANARRRLKLVFLSLLPGTTAFILGLLVSLLHAGRAWEEFVGLLQAPTTMLGSAIYAYAVVRHRLFNIRVLVRNSIQYALARGTLFVLMSLPVIGLAAFLYAHRRDSLAVLLTGMPAMYLLLILPLVAVIRYRKRVLESLDRRFFREQYDARHLLLHVVSMIRSGSDILTIARAALDEIDRALHPKHLSLWQLDPDAAALHRGFSIGAVDFGEDGRVLTDAGVLPANGTLATLLAADDDPLDIPSRHTRALLQRLPESEREWLRATDAYLIVPLMIDKRLVGMMVLGERKSEEPYSKEDRDLLRTLGAQLALTLDYTRLKQSPSLVWSPSTSSAPVHLHLSDALQLCPRCGRCYAANESQCEHDQQTLVPESGVPRIIEEKYVVTRLLGRGGMGSVYQATQTRLNRPVAVKVLLAHLVGSSSMRTRFEREARIVARLRHPAIVTIHDFGVLPSGHAYLVMEYLDGDTLRKTIASGPQPYEDALAILRPVGEAIDAAHRVGVIHRDLKPENIMIVRGHNAATGARVLDFGLAKMTTPIGEDEATLVQSGHSAGVVGTLMYMAPEVLSGHAADTRADQYSLAIIAYELLAGEHPLGGATDLASVVRGHTDVPMIPLRERVRSVPVHVAAAVDRALSKKPAERFGSVGEFVEALRG